MHWTDTGGSSIEEHIHHSARHAERAGFENTFTIDRKDYGIEWNKALDSGGVILGDEVKVTLNLELLKKK